MGIKAWAILLVGTLSIGASAAEVTHLHISDSINPATASYVIRGLQHAADTEAALAVLQLDTPGGLDTAMKDIVEAVLGSPVPVVVWVGPPGARASSAGAFILLAADVAAMARGTTVGAAHPVALAPDSEAQDDTVTEKVVSEAVARIRSIAELRGRNEEWAEKAVRESATATASEAVELNVADLLADKMPELLTALEGWELPDGRVLRTEGVAIQEVPMSLRERLFSVLANPNLVYILFMLGLYGLIYEFFSPGVGFGFATGGISMILALLGLQVLPFSFAGLGLIVFGALLMVLDVFTQTDGILTVGGIVSLVVGSFSLFDLDSPALGLSWPTVAATVGILSVVFVFVISKGLLAQRHPRRALTTMVGLTGVAEDDLEQGEGWVKIRGEYWRARAEGDTAHKGDEVEVVRQEGRSLVVRRR
ncbi:MAG: nodulation protein NfeD [Candidatus Bipolaricaulota bacterium]